MQAYQIVSIIIVVGCNITFDIRSLDKSSTLIIFPCTVNAIWEDKLQEFLPTIEFQRVDAPLHVSDGLQCTSLIGITKTVTVWQCTFNHTVILIIFP